MTKVVSIFSENKDVDIHVNRHKEILRLLGLWTKSRPSSDLIDYYFRQPASKIDAKQHNTLMDTQ